MNIRKIIKKIKEILGKSKKVVDVVDEVISPDETLSTKTKSPEGK